EPRTRAFFWLWLALVAVVLGAGAAWTFTYMERKREVATRHDTAERLQRRGGYDDYANPRAQYIAILKLTPRDDRASAELAAVHALGMLDYGEDVESIVQTMTRRAEQQLVRHHSPKTLPGFIIAQSALGIRRGELDRLRQ